MQSVWKKFENENAPMGNEKMKDERMEIPSPSNYTIFLKYNYTIPQLKKIATVYSIKQGGTKGVLFNRILSFFKLTQAAIKIQGAYRFIIYKKCKTCRGPALMNRALCTNDTDFLSGENIKEIPSVQFISFRDVDSFVYGFDILYLFHLIKK